MFVFKLSCLGEGRKHFFVNFTHWTLMPPSFFPPSKRLPSLGLLFVEVRKGEGRDATCLGGYSIKSTHALNLFPSSTFAVSKVRPTTLSCLHMKKKSCLFLCYIDLFSLPLKHFSFYRYIQCYLLLFSKKFSIGSFTEKKNTIHSFAREKTIVIKEKSAGILSIKPLSSFFFSQQMLVKSPHNFVHFRMPVNSTNYGFFGLGFSPLYFWGFWGLKKSSKFSLYFFFLFLTTAMAELTRAVVRVRWGSF